MCPVKAIAASAPDRVETWTEGGMAMRAQIWDDLILPGVIPGPQAQTFRVYAIYDPAYTTPWLLATPLKLKAATVKAMLSLLAGSILSYLAATVPAAPTGFWDRQPRRTPWCFRRMLMGKPFPQSYPLPGQLRKKASATGHLPKGILAHRRKSTASTPLSVS
ncbi:MAG: hypothetical protein L0Z70_12020 [Chloroflexi bacterium]|nr:hypothetical protein [Chloroflexota bacterium]